MAGSLESVLASIPFLGGYEAQNQQSRLKEHGDLVNAGALEKILAAMEKQKKEAQFQAALSTAKTPEERVAVAERFSGAEGILKHSDRLAAADQTKQIAMSRLSQQFQRDAADLAHKQRTATTAEERFHWQQQMDVLRANATKQSAEIAAGRYNYDTGASVAPFQGVVPQPAPAAPAAGQLHLNVPPSDAAAYQAAAAGGSGTVNRQMSLEEIAGMRDMSGGDPKLIPVSASGVIGVPAAPQNNMDARDLRLQQPQQAPAAPVAAPPSAAAGTPPQMPPHVAQMPKKFQDAWRAAQVKADVNIAGGRESVMMNRVVTGGNQVEAALANIVKLPMSSSRGFFGGRGQDTGILNAGKETLANTMTTQEVQSYNVLTTGIQRGLAAIESSGLAPPGSLMHQMDAVVWKEGWTNFTKLQALAETRQIVEKGMEVIIANRRADPELKALVQKIIDGVRKSVPFTNADLIDLQGKLASNPKVTLADVLKEKEARAGKPSADQFFR